MNGRARSNYDWNSDKLNSISATFNRQFHYVQFRGQHRMGAIAIISFFLEVCVVFEP